MPKILYVRRKFSPKSMLLIEQANKIIAEYLADGFVLTLRQLYYQFVARDLIPNTMQSYKNLGSVVNDGRLAGLIDWEAIEDRTRSLRERSHWDDPGDVIKSAAQSYGVDLWHGQHTKPEVWIEKDALIGVVERVCTKWDVPYFSCRGYTSQSEVWRASVRHMTYDQHRVLVIHLGDHDPSGIDMTRDIEERLRIFGANTRIDRIALNMDQVERHALPPNPVKITDSRFAKYAFEHGDESWELDALDPKNIESMIEEKILDVVDQELFDRCETRQEKDRELLLETSGSWDQVVDFLTDTRKTEPPKTVVKPKSKKKRRK